MARTPTAYEAIALQQLVAQHAELRHIRVRGRGDTLILESGPEKDATRHARLQRRDTVQLWHLEMPSRGAQREPTGIRGTRAELLAALLEHFPWTLANHDWEPAAN